MLINSLLSRLTICFRNSAVTGKKSLRMVLSMSRSRESSYVRDAEKTGILPETALQKL
jgi:hypothetical protein